ncbi:MAG: flotillin-like FloA family protein [Planctomycetota bacterium]|jgi:uncharacterized protein YqfA (UPF0365 family)
MYKLYFVVLGYIAAYILIHILIGFFSTIPVWFMAKLSGVSVSMMDIIGMHLRKCPPRLVVDAYIMMVHGGEKAKLVDVEWVYLAYGNLVTDSESLAELVREKASKKRGKNL